MALHSRGNCQSVQQVRTLRLRSFAETSVAGQPILLLDHQKAVAVLLAVCQGFVEAFEDGRQFLRTVNAATLTDFLDRLAILGFWSPDPPLDNLLGADRK